MINFPLIEPFSEKYLEKLIKKLTGRNDIGDALRRLDWLTQEEARMTSAQLLEIANAIDGEVGQIADGVDRMERSWFQTVSMLDMKVQSFLQGVNYDRISVDGSRHQIHLRVTISLVTPITKEHRPGFSREEHIRNGSQQVPSPHSGFMGNVRPSHSAARPHLITILICSWLRQEHTLVRRAFVCLFLSKISESLVVF